MKMQGSLPLLLLLATQLATIAETVVVGLDVGAGFVKVHRAMLFWTQGRPYNIIHLGGGGKTW